MRFPVLVFPVATQRFTSKPTLFCGLFLLLSAACGSSQGGGGTGGKGGTGGRGDGNGGATSGTGGRQGTGGVGGGQGIGGRGGGQGTGGDNGTGGAGGAPFALKCDLAQVPGTGVVLAAVPSISDFTYTTGTDAVRAASFSFGNYTDSPSGYGFHYPDRDLSQCGGADGGAGGTGPGGEADAASGGIGGADGGETDGGIGGADGSETDGGIGGADGSEADGAAAGDASGTPGTAGGPGADGAAGAGGSCAAPGLTEDFTGSKWHIVGRVNSFAAFAVGAVCNIDASSFLGIEFTIRGNAGTPSQLRVEVGFADDTQGSHDPAYPLLGTCDFNCVSPAAVIPVTETETRVRLPWSMFQGGTPMDSVNPRAINSINWQFLGGAASSAYDVDVTVDSLRFMTVDSADGGAD